MLVRDFGKASLLELPPLSCSAGQESGPNFGNMERRKRKQLDVLSSADVRMCKVRKESYNIYTEGQWMWKKNTIESTLTVGCMHGGKCGTYHVPPAGSGQTPA